MSLQQEIAGNYNTFEIKEARSYFVLEHNIEVQDKIDRHQFFIEAAEKEVGIIEASENPYTRHRLDLLNHISERENKIEKLKKQLLEL